MSDLVKLAEDRLPPDWTVKLSEMWCQLRPNERELRRQGWKLHVSATVASAAEVLARSLDVLLPARCVFKFANAPARVGELNGARFARGSAGKFITVYPADDDEFRRLAFELDQATKGMAGPMILSDRPYRAGSIVHYRYGAFVGERMLDNDGQVVEIIRAPDGTPEPDRREAWFSPPAWATCPLPEPPPAEDVNGVLLADRFVVRQAIRHANKGGIFEATDHLSGAEVVVKQARAHVELARDCLRNEAEMLAVLSEFGVCPAPLAYFEQGGDEFLVEERIQGITLRGWVAGHERMPWATLVAMAGKLVDLLDRVHSAGIVLRDLSSTNVMVRADDTPVLLDLEVAARQGIVCTTISGTPGYLAPEQRPGAVLEPAVDLYALGALLMLMITGEDPLLTDGPDRAGRLVRWLELVAQDDERARRAQPLIAGLLAEHQRWGIDQVRAFLAASAPDPLGRKVRRLLRDGTDYLVASMTPDAEDRLWPMSYWGTGSDSLNVHHGAGGVLAALTWLDICPDVLRTAADWIEKRLLARTKVLPGLNFGSAGPAWALYDAAKLLGDDGRAARMIDVVKRLPSDWPNPDVTHGIAGAGTTALALWLDTGDEELAEQARRCARALAERVDGEPLWRVPESFDSLLAGTIDYGFAHGAAGIASFLLAAGTRLGEPAWVRLAEDTGRMLCDVAHVDRFGARWPAGPTSGGRPLEFWCSGAAGIGTFLIRLWQATGEERARTLAELAGQAVWTRRWRLGTSVCHGLAGGGELLLDLAEATGDDYFRHQAVDLADAIAVRASEQDGRLLAPDETMIEFGADYAVGVAGWVAFLHRLAHGGPRRWLVAP